MPILKVCSFPGCKACVPYGVSYCAEHKKVMDVRRERIEEKLRKEREARRVKRSGNSSARGYGSRWQAARRVFLMANPLCVECLKKGIITQATDVDHIIPHKGDRSLFWDQSNWQALCHSCHSRKTASEDGGFGLEQKQEKDKG